MSDTSKTTDEMLSRFFPDLGRDDFVVDPRDNPAETWWLGQVIERIGFILVWAIPDPDRYEIKGPA